MVFLVMVITLEHLNQVNQCQVAEMDQAGKTLDPKAEGSCVTFAIHVRNVQAAVIHTYQITAFESLRQADPEIAAKLWKSMMEFCESALTALRQIKEQYPFCGAPSLYDLALDYRGEAEKRYYQNLQDSECLKITPPSGLFPKTT